MKLKDQNTICLRKNCQKIKMPQRILVTGSEGIVGKIIVPALQKEGNELILLDKKSENPVNLLDDYILNYFNGIETVVHLAGNTFWIDKQKAGENVMMTFNVLEASRKANVQRIVYASSINVYDYSTLYLQGKNINAETPLSPHKKSEWKERKESVFYYSMSKITCEDLIRKYHENHGISAINLRFGAINPQNIPYENEPDDYAIWLSHEDLKEIAKKAIKFNGFESVVCVSDNSEGFVNLGHLENVLGYRPKSNSKKDKMYILPP